MSFPTSVNSTLSDIIFHVENINLQKNPLGHISVITRVVTKPLFSQQVNYSYFSDSSQVIDSSLCVISTGKSSPEFVKSGSVGRF